MPNMELSPGKIYLAEQRGLLENEVHRRYSTFNFAEFYNEHKQAFGRLCVFNDEILPAGGRLSQKTITEGFLLIIPITGAVIVKLDELELEADAGQVFLTSINAKTNYELINPFPAHWVNFLHIEIRADSLIQPYVQLFNFDVETNKNQMIDIIDHKQLPFSLYTGRFNGREEMLYPVRQSNNQIFAFSIAGAFELQNRLIHERDGLALWDTKQVDAEALSNGALLLLIALKSPA